VPDILLPGIDGAAENLFGDAAVLEDGWVLTQDGGMRVSVRTDMPGVTPAMVDWWFGWHGDAAAKYKLWHPQAHVHAGWRETPPAGTSGCRGCCCAAAAACAAQRISGHLIQQAVQAAVATLATQAAAGRPP
jgi:hypothetical protein